MQKFLWFASIALLAACAEFPGVYRINIEQGNIVSPDMVQQLKPGMTKRQVRFIMGTPLVRDTFNPQRWDYVYSLQRGGDERLQESLVVFFDEKEQLVSWKGSDKLGPH